MNARSVRSAVDQTAAKLLRIPCVEFNPEYRFSGKQCAGGGAILIQDAIAGNSRYFGTR